jgi:hypothetical protein
MDMERQKGADADRARLLRDATAGILLNEHVAEEWPDRFLA